MPKPRLDLSVIRDSSWLHWAATIPLLAAHLAGIPGVLLFAQLLCGVMAAAYFAQTKSIRSMPVQVRVGYFALLTFGALPFCSWIHWTQLIGTTAMVLVGYCPLLRMLRMLPWNRSTPFSWSLVKKVFLVDASQGGLVEFETSTASAPHCEGLETCSLVNRPQKKMVGLNIE